jgi:hypothetical protein
MAVVQLIAIVLLAVVAGGPILQSSRTEHQAPDTLHTVKRPYQKLFITPLPQPGKPVPPELPSDALTARSEQRPRIVCGMVVVPVTPDADAKMVVRPKATPKPDYKIRVIEPRLCNE